MSQGSFVWHDLMTGDVEKAKSFYTSVFGWTIDSTHIPGSDQPYEMINDGHEGTGGITALQQEGVPPHWLPTVTVNSMDSALTKVEELGGQLLNGPVLINGTGKWAVIVDDQGAAIGIMEAENESEVSPGGTPKVGQFCWYSLSSHDAEKASKFYGELLGWDCKEQDLGGGQSQPIFMKGDQQIAGLNISTDKPPNWSCAVVVEDLDAATEKAKSLGANVLMPKMPVGDFGEFNVITDPTGAVISMFAEGPS